MYHLGTYSWSRQFAGAEGARMVRMLKWYASDMVYGEEPCVRTRAGWASANGRIYGRGVLPTLFGLPAQPLSAAVMRRVRAELAGHKVES